MISLTNRIPTLLNRIPSRISQIQQFRNLVVKSLAITNLPIEITQEKLESFLTEKQIPHKAVRIYKNSRGETTGMAFVDVDESDVESSIFHLDQSVVDDKLIKVKMAAMREAASTLAVMREKGELITLMVYNLPSNVTGHQLHSLFASKIPVLAVRILNKGQTDSSKVAFIDVHPSQLSKAIKEFHDESHFNRIIGVTLAANTFMPAFRVLKNRQSLTTLRLGNVPQSVDREQLLTLLKHEFPVFGLEASEGGEWKVSILDGSIERAINALNGREIEGASLSASVDQA